MLAWSCNNCHHEKSFEKMKKMKTTVSICIVNFNTRALLKRCLRSIISHQSSVVSHEIIVVDNGSSDGSAKMVEKEFPQVRLIKNKDNKFFTVAYNQAAKKARGRYLLILNSDTYFVDQSLKKLVAFMDKHPEIGIAEGLQIEENGKIIPTGTLETSPWIDFCQLTVFGRLVKGRRVKKFLLSSWDRRESKEVEVACDAFALVRTDLFKKISGYDENFLLYYTENDLCKRIRQAGFKVFHYAGAKVIHRLQASTDQFSWLEKSKFYQHDLACYYQKYGPRWAAYILPAVIQLSDFLIYFKKFLIFNF